MLFRILDSPEHPAHGDTLLVNSEHRATGRRSQLRPLELFPAEDGQMSGETAKEGSERQSSPPPLLDRQADQEGLHVQAEAMGAQRPQQPLPLAGPEETAPAAVVVRPPGPLAQQPAFEPAANVIAPDAKPQAKKDPLGKTAPSASAPQQQQQAAVPEGLSALAATLAAVMPTMLSAFQQGQAAAVAQTAHVSATLPAVQMPPSITTEAGHQEPGALLGAAAVGRQKSADMAKPLTGSSALLPAHQTGSQVLKLWAPRAARPGVFCLHVIVWHHWLQVTLAVPVQSPANWCMAWPQGVMLYWRVASGPACLPQQPRAGSQVWVKSDLPLLGRC